jgi:hypothetical protein
MLLDGKRAYKLCFYLGFEVLMAVSKSILECDDV